MLKDDATPQEIFDYVCSNLIKQGKQSKSNGKCVYRGPDGTRCAAGWLMDDECAVMMDDKCKGKVITLTPPDGITLPLVIQNNINLVQFLQNAHDIYDDTLNFDTLNFVDDFKREARRVAERFNLNTDVLT